MVSKVGIKNGIVGTVVFLYAGILLFVVTGTAVSLGNYDFCFYSPDTLVFILTDTMVLSEYSGF
jgi:hypothetical protein